MLSDLLSQFESMVRSRACSTVVSQRMLARSPGVSTTGARLLAAEIGYTISHGPDEHDDVPVGGEGRAVPPGD